MTHREGRTETAALHEILPQRNSGSAETDWWIKTSHHYDIDQQPFISWNVTHLVYPKGYPTGKLRKNIKSNCDTYLIDTKRTTAFYYCLWTFLCLLLVPHVPLSAKVEPLKRIQRDFRKTPFPQTVRKGMWEECVVFWEHIQNGWRISTEFTVGCEQRN